MTSQSWNVPISLLSGRTIAVATIGGLMLGVAYTLSPLTVWAALATVLLGRALARDLGPTERRVLLAIFAVAVLLRVLVIAGLFASVDHWETPFGSLFGDEEYFKRRSLYLRSMAVDVNISEADRVYALDEYSETSYLQWLAFLQILVGDAPYGVHLFGMVAYLAAAVWMYRFSRRTFGPAPAALTFTTLLFLPTLFFWSVSALRESVHFLLTFAAVAGASDALSGTRWRDRILGGTIAVLATFALKDLRVGSMGAVAVAIAAGGAASWALAAWRRLTLVALIGLVAAAVVLSRPAVQDRLLTRLQGTAFRHQGHAFTGAPFYKLLEPRYYQDRFGRSMDDMTWPDAGRYVARALTNAVIQPLPWTAHTRLLGAYLPEQMLWLLMCLLLPIGVWAGALRHPAASLLMAAFVAVMFTGIALVSGNVGTLVRHRGLVLPFVICLAAVAACHLLARPASADGVHERTLTDGAH